MKRNFLMKAFVCLFTVIVLCSFSAGCNLAPMGNLGNFIGGLAAIISAISVVLLYITLRAQQKSIKQQNDQFQTKQFENKFFKLIDIQQKLSSDITGYFYSLGKEDLKKHKEEVQGREFFMYAIAEIIQIWKSINTKTYYGLYDEEYIIYKQHDIEEIKTSDDPDKENKISTIIKESMIQFTNRYYEITKEKWNEIHDLSEIQKIKHAYEIFFNQYRYSHEIYITNLSYMISYVKDFFKDKERVKQYISIIQAQTLYFEKFIIVFHAIYCKEFRKLLVETNFLEHIDDSYLNNITDKKFNSSLSLIFRRYKNIGRRLAAINK